MNEYLTLKKLELIKPKLKPQLVPIADSIIESYLEVGSVSSYSMDMAKDLIGRAK